MALGSPNTQAFSDTFTVAAHVQERSCLVQQLKLKLQDIHDAGVIKVCMLYPIHVFTDSESLYSFITVYLFLRQLKCDDQQTLLAFHNLQNYRTPIRKANCISCTFETFKTKLINQ